MGGIQAKAAFLPHAGHWRVHLCFVCLAVETLPELESGSQERGSNGWQRAYLHPRVRAHGRLCAKTQAQAPTSLNAVESDIGSAQRQSLSASALLSNHVL